MEHNVTISDYLYRRANLLLHQGRRLNKLYINGIEKHNYSQENIDRLVIMRRTNTARQAIILRLIIEEIK